MTSRLAGEGRYAKVEREQRWVLDTVPSGITDVRTITDDYLVGTRLRLRKIESNGEVIFKLCQKVRIDEANPEHVKITNFYISPEEYSQVLSLPTSTIVKTRHTYVHDDAVFAIDRFHGRHVGLILAEREESESDLAHAAPITGWFEVTRDDRYSGGSLAFASDNELGQLIGAGNGN
jgi:CYTH domain-containing protein